MSQQTQLSPTATPTRLYGSFVGKELYVAPGVLVGVLRRPVGTAADVFRRQPAAPPVPILALEGLDEDQLGELTVAELGALSVESEVESFVPATTLRRPAGAPPILILTLENLDEDQLGELTVAELGALSVESEVESFVPATTLRRPAGAATP